MSSMRVSALPSVLLLTLLPLVATCGGRTVEGPRIVVASLEPGDPPAGLVLVPRADPSRRHPLVAVPAEGVDVYAAPGAPDGVFEVEGPDGWTMLHLGSSPPTIASDAAPPIVRIGRRYALYVGTSVHELRPGRAWVVRPVDGGPAVSLVAVLGNQGRLAILHLDPSVWHDEVFLYGRLRRGTFEPQGGVEASDDGPLVVPSRVPLAEGGQPRVLELEPAVESPLQVGLVPAEASAVVDDRPVTVRLSDLPLPLAWTARSRAGIALVPSVPALDRAVEVEVEGVPAVRVSSTDRRTFEAVYVLVPGGAGTRFVRLALPADAPPVVRIEARTEGAPAYGLVHLEEPPADRGDDGRPEVTITLPRRRASVLVVFERAIASLEVPGEGEGPFDVPPPDAGVVFQGALPAVRPGTSVAVRLFRHEDGARVTGNGLTFTAAGGNEVSGRIPTGTYDVEVATDHGTWRRPGPLDATTAGSQIHIRLQVP